MGQSIIAGFVSEYINDQLSEFFGLLADIQAYGVLCGDELFEKEDMYLDIALTETFFTFRLRHNADSYHHKFVELKEGFVPDDQVSSCRDYYEVTLTISSLLEEEPENENRPA